MIDPMFVLYAVFVFMITTAIGSFLNVVIYRLPLGMNLAMPASHCPKCNEPIKWYDNIPIISYIVLKGKCRKCHEKISPRYLIIELMTGIISTLIFIRFGLTLLSLFGILLFLILIPIAFIDIESMIIPDILVILLLVLGIFGIFFNDLDYGNGLIVIGYKSKLISLAIVAGFTIIIILLEKLFKMDLMGGGDLKLMFCAGLMLGWELLLLVLCISSVLACMCEITKQEINKSRNKKEEVTEEDKKEEKIKNSLRLFPFGPYLAISIVIAYTFGITIIEWWIDLISL
ncbi:MAG: prepilin peptidase [Bacilli bacterium]|nr:prepilin peptidase [Bacilli bacterium]